MKVVEMRTGLTSHAVRAWERRYGAITPDRTPTNRRLYSEGDIERLVLLKNLTEVGHPISHIATLPNDELKSLLRLADRTISGGGRERNVWVSQAPHHLDAIAPNLGSRALAAVQVMDQGELEATLKDSSAALGHMATLQHVIAPLIERMGDGWRDGTLRVVHEHFGTEVIRRMLSTSSPGVLPNPRNPRLLVTTPMGQLHELGAVMVASAAQHYGWSVVSLGPCTPAEEVLEALRQTHSDALALSIVYPDDDPDLGAELRRIASGAPPDTLLLAGGRAAPAYREVLGEAGFQLHENLDGLFQALDRYRRERFTRRGLEQEVSVA